MCEKYIDKGAELNDLINTIEGIAEKLNSGEKEAIKEMVSIVDGIERIIALKKIHKNEEDKIINMNKYLMEIFKAMESSDYILIGDLLVYELIPILEDIFTNME